MEQKSPKKKQDSRIPKRKMADSLDVSSVKASGEEEEEELEEIMTDGTKKLLLSPVKKLLLSPPK